jgi:hypothetical protein
MARKRVIYRVYYVARDREPGRRWEIIRMRLDGVTNFLARYRTKAEAVAEAADQARAEWRISTVPTQLFVHNKNGRIAFERTYGADPARRKG